MIVLLYSFVLISIFIGSPRPSSLRLRTLRSGADELLTTAQGVLASNKGIVKYMGQYFNGETPWPMGRLV